MRPLLAVVLAMAAIATGMSSCEQNLTKDDKLVFEIPKGHRLKLKVAGQTDEDAVNAFKRLLSGQIDANGGTNINLRYKPNHPDPSTAADGYKELYGPLQGTTDQFTPKPPTAPDGPNGSMHNTQRIVFKSDADVAAVLKSFDASFNP